MAKPLKVAFAEALADFDGIENSSLLHNSPDFQLKLTSTIQQWLLFQRATQANFSSNESLEDLNTSELKYLSVDYYIAQLYGMLIEPSKENNLKKSVLLYMSFLKRLNDYSLLDKSETTKLNKIKETPFKIINFTGDAMSNREEKIKNYKLEKSLMEQLKLLEKLENNEQEYLNTDEDKIRDLYFDQLKLLTIRSFNNIRLLTQEIEILQFVPKIKEIKEDRREKKKDATEFTDKLEDLSKQKEFLSKDGKILKPFTIMKREDLKKKVYGTGQYLPTMTVEDYLEQELANGGMVSSNPEPEESSDEDDYEKNDRDTYKAREWDEFTETHRKGSGNTINRG